MKRTALLYFVLSAAAMWSCAVARRAHRELGEPLTGVVSACGNRCAPVDARFAGGFRAGSAPATSDGSRRALLVAAGRLASRAEDGGNARLAEALAVARILVGARDEGIQALEQLLAREPLSARINTDLGAALIGRGLADHRVQDVVRGLSLSRRAASLSDRPEPLFNSARALEGVGLFRQALQGWDTYLAADPISDWSAIARRRRDALRGMVEAPLPFPEAAFEDVLLTAWPQAADTPRSEPHVRERLFDLARRCPADEMPLDASRALERLTPAARRATAAGLVAYRQARTLYDDDQPTAAASVFDDAWRALAAHDHPYALWARLYLGISSYLRGALDQADATMREVIAAETRRYTNLAGRAHYMRGLIAQTAASPVAALSEYQAAIIAARATQDLDNEAAALSQLAGVREMLGDGSAAWAVREQALAALPHLRSARRRHVILLSSARAALADGAPEAALEFADAALANARQWNRPGALTEVHTQLARIYLALRRAADALRAIASAEKALSNVTDAPFARRFSLELLAAAADARVVSGVSGVKETTDALVRLREARGALLIPATLHARARAWLREGAATEAEADLEAALTAFEQQRAAVPVAQGRVTSFPEYRATLGDLISLQMSHARARDAWATAERGRARSLLFAGNADTTIPLGDVQRRLKAGVALLYYAITDDRVYSWTITNGTFTARALNLNAAALAAEVEAFRRSLEAYNAQTAQTLGEQLFDQLLGSSDRALDHMSKLIVVPDDVLSAMPFAALRDRRSQQYLAERFELEIAPSAALAIASHDSRPADLDTALVIAPSVGGTRPLGGTVAEARAVAAYYGRARILVGAEATKQAVLSDLPQYDVVHFAGHAETSLDYPSLSRLVVHAVAGDGEDAVYAYDLNALRLPRTRLVVLAGCRTGVGRALRGEGALSLARQFVGAGVPAVVSTLWDMRDRPARVLFEAFHRLLPGQSPAAALRAAQLEMMSSADEEIRSPATWSGVFVIAARLTPPPPR